MGNVAAYSGLQIPDSGTADGDRLPLQLAVLDENVSDVIGRIAMDDKILDPFDKVLIPIDDRLDISWLLFGWRTTTGDYYGSTETSNCCYEWMFSEQQLQEFAQLQAEWESMVISEDRQAQVPQWVFNCMSKLLEYVVTTRNGHTGGIPATVCIMHILICKGGGFLIFEGWPYPLYDAHYIELLGNDMIKQTKQFVSWLTRRVECPRLNPQLLMENVRRLGETHNQRVVGLYVCGLYGVGHSGYEGRLRWIGSGAGFLKLRHHFRAQHEEA
jgi:hypothetical protein